MKSTRLYLWQERSRRLERGGKRVGSMMRGTEGEAGGHDARCNIQGALQVLRRWRSRGRKVRGECDLRRLFPLMHVREKALQEREPHNLRQSDRAESHRHDVVRQRRQPIPSAASRAASALRRCSPTRVHERGVRVPTRSVNETWERVRHGACDENNPWELASVWPRHRRVHSRIH
jgi:hypothetical protein